MVRDWFNIRGSVRLYLVSSTTKVLTNFSDFLQEINREEFRYVVPDFRLNKKFDQLNQMNTQQREKVEFLLYYMTRPEYQIHVRENIWIICWIFFE